MANTRISDLTASASNLASTDLAPVVQTAGVGPVKMTGLQLAGGLLGSTTFNGSTVTTSSPVLNLTQTWNASGVTFTGLKFNAATGSNANSASGSLLLDLQLEGASAVKVRKDGYIYMYGNGATGNSNYIGPYKFGSQEVLFFGPNFVSNGSLQSGFIDSRALLMWNANQQVSYAPDLFLSRGGTATLQLGAADAAAPVAQFFKVQGVVAGTTNTAGANFTIQGSQGTGNAAGGSIIFQVAPAGSSGTAQNAYSTALTIAGTGAASLPFGQLSIGSGATLGAINCGGTNIFTFYDAAGYGTQAIRLNAPGGLAFNLAGDTILVRDAANTLALRNGTNAQTFNVYGTYTASDNFERLAIQYGSSSDFVLRTEKGASGGSNRALTFETYGAATFTIAAQTLSTSSDGFYSWSTTTSSRGSANTRLYRDADGVVGVRGSGATSPAAMSFYTYGASPPAAPAASIVRIYADTSGGKIRLMALFPSGAAQQIAIEP